MRYTIAPGKYGGEASWSDIKRSLRVCAGNYLSEADTWQRHCLQVRHTQTYLSLYLWFINQRRSIFYVTLVTFCVTFLLRVSLDPMSQKMVGVLRYFLSQFSPKYRRGSVAEDTPPEALQKPLAQ